MLYIDIHSHLNFAAYDDDRDQVIKRVIKSEIGVINVGVDLDSSKKVIDIANKNNNMWACVALHPTNTASSFNDIYEHGGESKSVRPAQEFDYNEFAKLAKHPKVVAIGECGLDYFHSQPEDMENQRRVFLSHIKLANEVNKPLMLHVRNADQMNAVKSAYLEAVAILKEHSKTRANFHFFSGTKDDLRAILDIDGTVSFTGVLTFTREYDELVRYVPIDHIMSETDCPYVAPAPYRGKRNEPSFVREVVKTIAAIRGESESDVSSKLVKNAELFFTLA